MASFADPGTMLQPQQPPVRGCSEIEALVSVDIDTDAAPRGDEDEYEYEDEEDPAAAGGLSPVALASSLASAVVGLVAAALGAVAAALAALGLDAGGGARRRAKTLEDRQL
jgi:hypothetical protein